MGEHRSVSQERANELWIQVQRHLGPHRVPLQLDEVRVEREQIPEANIDAASSGPDTSEDEHEMTLSEEQVVVEKKTVPKERVRLAKDTPGESGH